MTEITQVTDMSKIPVYTPTCIQGARSLWLLTEVDNTLCQELVKGTSLPLAIVHALIARGFRTTAQIQDFIWTSYDPVLADPERMLHARRAVDRIILAIDRQEKS